ncbi:capsid triplex subunit 2 [Macropodid alphaherpesvirus 4]|uniref:Capsid triplex subunit 2 n=1 Tax=Macropodid alphaherpesvirus 4 TaxID=2762721 RepID=A0A7L7YSH1_9ALPH|nr:capsid triplex subunit 2 [Macropodid alphaherpesvirus 4]QOD40163.1 capsid triplex subunit 2 [Macropodid alphaherpesvirus 4]
MDTFEAEIAIPSGLTQPEIAALQRCEGQVVFLPTIRRKLTLREVSHESFTVGGVAPDTLGLIVAYNRRFPAVITRVFSTKLVVVPVDIGFTQNGMMNLRNTSPVDLCNGDSISLLPPILEGASTKIYLNTLNLTLLFPLTLPTPLAIEVTARLVARGMYALNPDPAIPRGPEGLNNVYYNGKRLGLLADINQLAPINETLRTLLLNMVYTITEGTSLVLALMPRLFALSAQDGYVNSLLHMQSITREVAQLIHPEAPRLLQDGQRRFPIYEAISAWITHASQLGHVLALSPIARVCAFDGPSVRSSNDLVPIIRHR